MRSATDLGLAGYETIESLDGDRCSVVRATELATGSDVAIKLLDRHKEPVLPKRFDRQRKALAKLAKSNLGVVPLLDSGTLPGGQEYVLMPYYANRSLQDQLERGPMPWRQLLQIMTSVSQIVGRLHDEEIVLGDIKPSSILLDDRLEPSVSVYGMATRRFDDGRPTFHAPEANGDQAPLPAADVYALSAISVALIAGRAKARNEPLANLLDDVVWRVPETFYEVIEHGLAQRPENRHGNGKLMHRALISVAEDETRNGFNGAKGGNGVAAANGITDADDARPADVSAVLPSLDDISFDSTASADGSGLAISNDDISGDGISSAHKENTIGTAPNGSTPSGDGNSSFPDSQAVSDDLPPGLEDILFESSFDPTRTIEIPGLAIEEPIVEAGVQRAASDLPDLDDILFNGHAEVSEELGADPFDTDKDTGDKDTGDRSTDAANADQHTNVEDDEEEDDQYTDVEDGAAVVGAERAPLLEEVEEIDKELYEPSVAASSSVLFDDDPTVAFAAKADTEDNTASTDLPAGGDVFEGARPAAAMPMSVVLGTEQAEIPFRNMSAVGQRPEASGWSANVRIAAEVAWYQGRRTAASAAAVIGLLAIGAVAIFFLAKEIQTSGGVEADGIPLAPSTSLVEDEPSGSDMPFITEPPSTTARERPTVATRRRATTTAPEDAETDEEGSEDDEDDEPSEDPDDKPEPTRPPKDEEPKPTDPPDEEKPTTTKAEPPKATVTTKKPTVTVTTKKPRVTVTTKKPRVTVTTKKPTVTVTTKKATTVAPTTTRKPREEETDEAKASPEQLALVAPPRIQSPRVNQLGRTSASVSYSSDQCVATKFVLTGSDGSRQTGSSSGYNPATQCSGSWQLSFSGSTSLEPDTSYVLSIWVKGQESGLATSSSISFKTTD